MSKKESVIGNVVGPPENNTPKPDGKGAGKEAVVTGEAISTGNAGLDPATWNKPWQPAEE